MLVFKVVFIYLAIQCFRTDAEEKVVANDLKSVKKLLDSLEKRVNQLNESTLRTEKRVDYLEIITRKDGPRTCQELRDLGVTKSGDRVIDPDGPGVGEPPIKVYCDMDSEAAKKFGAALTRINLTSAIDEKPVRKCEEYGCANYSVKYNASATQMKALIDQSIDCFQDIFYRCRVAPLWVNGKATGWWIGSNNVSHYYWDGHKTDPTNHTCQCEGMKECPKNGFTCRCDDSAYTDWTFDKGRLTNKAALPVQKFHFGGLRYPHQEAKFSLGPLICAGKKA